MGYFRNILVPNSIIKSLLLQPLAMTLRTFRLSKKLVGPFLSIQRGFAVHDRFQIFHYAIIFHEVVSRSLHKILRDTNVLHTSIKHLVERFLWNIPDGSLQVAVILMQNGVDLPEYHLVLIFSKWRDGTLVNAQFVIGYHFFQVDPIDIPQSLASRASPLRRIKRKDIRRRITISNPAYGIHQPLGEIPHLARSLVENHQRSISLPHGCSYRLAETLLL